MGDLSGKIYRLVCSDGRFYIGYTEKTLEERFKKHISKSREKRESGRKLYKHISNIGGWEQVKIELICDISGASRPELLALESSIIENEFLELGCLNSGRSFITAK
jgi:GIY-YIG catalytic domain